MKFDIPHSEPKKEAPRPKIMQDMADVIRQSTLLDAEVQDMISEMNDVEDHDLDVPQEVEWLGIVGRDLRKSPDHHLNATSLSTPPQLSS